jgi:hypothetical protein
MIAVAEPATLCEVAPFEAATIATKNIVEAGGGRRTPIEALEQAVLRRIAQRTWGRLRQVHVEVDRQRVIVRGSAPTYYLKQLALVAVQEVLPDTPVEHDILVAKSELPLASARNSWPELF